MPTVEERITAVEGKIDAIADLKAMVGEFRADMRQELADVRTEMNQQFAEVRTDMNRRFERGRIGGLKPWISGWSATSCGWWAFSFLY